MPDSCCYTQSRKCGYKPFLELHSLIAYDNPDAPEEYSPNQLTHFTNTSSRIIQTTPMQIRLTNKEIAQLGISKDSILDKSMKSDGYDPCATAVVYKPVYFLFKSNYNVSSSNQTTQKYTYTSRVLNSWELCKNTTYWEKTRDEYLTWSFDHRQIIRTQKVSNYLELVMLIIQT